MVCRCAAARPTSSPWKQLAETQDDVFSSPPIAARKRPARSGRRSGGNARVASGAPTAAQCRYRVTTNQNALLSSSHWGKNGLSSLENCARNRKMCSEVNFIFVLFPPSFPNDFVLHENYCFCQPSSRSSLIFRHGDRSPFTSFPTDQYFNPTYWPMGFGQLTKQGIRRQYELGRWFRERYDGFLSEIYSPLEINVQSTDRDRTLMSAAATAAGLYPPKEFQVWNPEIHWQPIPVHMGYETNVMDLPCAKYDKMSSDAAEAVDRAVEDQFSDLYQLVREYSGWTNLSVNSVSNLRSVMYAYKNYNVSFVPDWFKEMNQSLVDHIAGKKYTKATATPAMARLKVGTFYDHIFNYFDKFKFTNSTPAAAPPKFTIMASHDTTIVSILNSMGLYDTPVGFGDTFIMELKKMKGKFFLNLLYKSEDGLKELIFKNCGLNCDYDEFKISLRDVVVDVKTRTEECAMD